MDLDEIARTNCDSFGSIHENGLNMLLQKCFLHFMKKKKKLYVQKMYNHEYSIFFICI